MSEGIDWEEALWSLESYKEKVLAIRDAAMDQPNFTREQFVFLAGIACGFAGSFTLLEVINLLKDPDIIKLVNEKQKVKLNEYCLSNPRNG